MALTASAPTCQAARFGWTRRRSSGLRKGDRRLRRRRHRRRRGIRSPRLLLCSRRHGLGRSHTTRILLAHFAHHICHQLPMRGSRRRLTTLRVGFGRHRVRRVRTAHLWHTVETRQLTLFHPWDTGEEVTLGVWPCAQQFRHFEVDRSALMRCAPGRSDMKISGR